MNTKAEAIRAALAELGVDASFRKVRDWMKEKGLSAVAPQQVSNEKRKIRNKDMDEDLPLALVKKVKQLVDDVGSIEKVRRALDELEMLRS